MRIAVIGGAGLMGSGTVKDLVSKESNDIDKVIIADMDIGKARKLAEELEDGRLEAVQLVVTDKEKMTDLLQSVDVCVNGVPTFAGYQMDIFHCCLESRCPYVDYGGVGIYTVKQKAEHETWAKQGVSAILGLGADPGISNVLCKAVAEKLDSIDKISLYWAAQTCGPENPVLVPPYNINTLLSEYGHESKQFIDGKLVSMPPQSGKEIMDLPEPFGRMEFIHTTHSEPLTVPFAKGIMDKGIKQFTWKLHLPQEEHQTYRALIRAGFGDFNEPLRIKGVDILPGEFLAALIQRNIEKNKGKIPEQEHYEIHFAVGEGFKGDHKTKAICTVYAYPDPFYEGYNDPATSMSASIGAQALGMGKIQPGVWGPEECLNVQEFFAELRKRCFKITMEVRTIEEDMGM